MNHNNTKDHQQEKESRPKLGLALSGGGFRASFFHIGVLAQMAELGLLRHVEVISTVSGGSIIGALYYLHVKKLLDNSKNKKIENRAYVDIIHKIEEDFLKAVQRNIRMRTFCNPVKNIRMSRANYSRSDRLGELYDKYFYRKVLDEKRKTMLQMRELKIFPDGNDFYPRRDNIGRDPKVPILLLNATTLNTGHNWRFTASRMGEPPRIDELARDIDKNFRLRRPPSYDDVIENQQNVELGLAVAASACVPGLFHPLAISGLYPDDIRVQLVDGGVHDNQGIQGLLDEDCTLFIISDASGQMGDEPDPATSIASVVLRSNSILMDRVREEQIFHLYEKCDFESQRIALMHLQKGVKTEEKPWINADRRPAEDPHEDWTTETKSTDFGVAEPVQKALSRVRTDLDSFSEVEAYSLMLDGYQMSEHEINKAEGILGLINNTPKDKNDKWNFLTVKEWMKAPNDTYQKHLSVAGERVFKVFRLSKILNIATIIISIIILAWLVIACGNKILNIIFWFLSAGPLIVLILLLILAILPRIIRAFRLPALLISIVEFPVNFIFRGFFPALASLFVCLHLWIFDCLFIWLGRVQRLGPKPQK